MAKADVKQILEQMRKLSLEDKFLIVHQIVKENHMGDSSKLSEEQKNWIRFADKASKGKRKFYTRKQIDDKLEKHKALLK